MEITAAAPREHENVAELVQVNIQDSRFLRAYLSDTGMLVCCSKGWSNIKRCFSNVASADKANGEPFIYLLNKDLLVCKVGSLTQIGVQSTKY